MADVNTAAEAFTHPHGWMPDRRDDGTMWHCICGGFERWEPNQMPDDERAVLRADCREHATGSRE